MFSLSDHSFTAEVMAKKSVISGSYLYLKAMAPYLGLWGSLWSALKGEAPYRNAPMISLSM